MRSNTRRNAAFTIVELLIAFTIFVVMIAGLVALMVGTLRGWRVGERGKDSYERAQGILRQLQEDLRCAYVDPDWPVDPGGVRLLPAQTICDVDDTGRQELALVRAVPAGPAEARRAGRPWNAIAAYVELREVLYRLDPEHTTLWRVERPFDRTDTRKSRSLLNPKNRSGADRVPLDNGVLHLEFRFWSQATKTWETDQHPRHGGASLLWDSSRRELNDFFLQRRGGRTDDPAEFVMPRIVRVILVVEPITGDPRGTVLAAPLSPADSVMIVEDSRELPDPPAFVRVGAEWIEYSAKEPGRLAIGRRPKAVNHEAGETVRFGETFVADVVIPVARDAP